MSDFDDNTLRSIEQLPQGRLILQKIQNLNRDLRIQKRQNESLRGRVSNLQDLLQHHRNASTLASSEASAMRDCITRLLLEEASVQALQSLPEPQGRDLLAGLKASASRSIGRGILAWVERAKNMLIDWQDLLRAAPQDQEQRLVEISQLLEDEWPTEHGREHDECLRVLMDIRREIQRREAGGGDDADTLLAIDELVEEGLDGVPEGDPLQRLHASEQVCLHLRVLMQLDPWKSDPMLGVVREWLPAWVLARADAEARGWTKEEPG